VRILKRLGLVVLTLIVLFAGFVVYVKRRDADRVIPGGGVFVPGWTGKIDASSARQGRILTDARLAQEGEVLHVTTGPAVTYWNPADIATGDYVVKATFLEPRFMALNSHPHSYGIFIGGHDMGTDAMSLVYCVAYGDGSALVRGFGPDVFTMLAKSAHGSIHKAAAVGEPVTQEIAWVVKGGRAECVINGAVVAAYAKGELVGAGKLKSTDGVFGIRVTHNIEALISGFGVTQP
jgi:hypothetical protein